MDKKKNRILPRAPKTSWIILIMVWIVYAFNTGSREIMNKVMPSMVEYFGMSASTSGLLSTVGTVGGGVLAVFIGAWADKRGTGWLRGKSQVIVAACYLLLTFLTGLPAFSSIAFIFIFQFLRFGFTAGGEAIDASACAEWFPDEYQGFIISAHHTGYPWGSALVSLLVAYILAQTGDWHMPFLIIPLCPIVFWIIYLAYSKKKRFIANNEAMVRMGLTPHVTTEEVERDSQLEHGANEKGVPFYKLFKNKNVLAAFISYAFIVGAYFGFNYWLTPYLTYQCGMENSAAAAFSVVFTITSGLGQLFWGTVSDRVGAKRTVLICAAWLFLCFLLLPLMRLGTFVLVAIQLVMGFCMNASFPVLYTLAGASVSKEQLATAISCCNFSMVIGGLFPYIIGMFINAGGGFESAAGYNVSLVFMCASLAIGFLATLLLAHEVTGPRRGRDWALTSYESCGITPAEKK